MNKILKISAATLASAALAAVPAVLWHSDNSFIMLGALLLIYPCACAASVIWSKATEKKD